MKFRVEIEMRVKVGKQKVHKNRVYMVNAPDPITAQMKGLEMAREEALEVVRIVSVDEVYH